MIVSTTLAGPGAEASIVDALRSCSHLVDLHLVLAPKSELARLEAVTNAIDSPCVLALAYEWPGSYGEARTEALRQAEHCGADWALTVDCDERIEIPKMDLGGISPDVHVLHVPDAVLAYQKPRFIRCGVGARWVGACSERLEVSGKRAIIPGQFRELPKTPEQERRRYERGLEHMPAMMEAEPTQPQWRRHYAECLIGVGRHDEGIAQLRALLAYPDLVGNAEAWAQYRIAEWEISREEFGAAFERCAMSLARFPGFIQEFGYLLAHLNIKQKRPAEGVLWAEYALSAPLDMTRGGHRSPTWRECCENILASARDSQGRPARPPQKPAEQVWTAEHFAARADFAPDYARLARALIETLSFSSHLDLGAGNGLLVGAMRADGVTSFGYEASEAAREHCPENLRLAMDFDLPLEQWGSDAGIGRHGFRCDHDLVSCVEVAEHIPAERADELVEAVCSRARRWVYWSAAAPGQGGVGHVNEQPQGYWIEKFRARGWGVDFESTRNLVDKLAACRRCWWLQRNALILKPL